MCLRSTEFMEVINLKSGNRADATVKKVRKGNPLALKSLLRSPAKTLLTFLLIASASFALFSRVTDYTVTMREMKNAESFYHGVAALDNTVPIIYTETVAYRPESKPWPTEEELEMFSSLPGVTLADTRYMTAGLAEDYEVLYDENDVRHVMLEGVYAGYEEEPGSDFISLKFEEVKVIASECDIKLNDTAQIECYALEEMALGKNSFTQSYFDSLKTGTRCLLMCTNDYTSHYVATLDQKFYDRPDEALRVIDGLGEDYLETEEFAYQKEWAEMIEQDSHIFDIVYTSDMRAIPRFNERGMVIVEGRCLTTEDMGTKACVVNELFLEENNLSIGDTVCVRLGDLLCPQLGRRAKNITIERRIKFADSIELTIVGAYSMVDDWMTRMSQLDWCYTPNAVFVPVSLLPVKVPDNYETCAGEFSVFIEDARDIEAFREAAEPVAAGMNLALRFSDRGWKSVKDSFETGTLASFLTTILYIIGAVLALFFAVYLYIGRSKKDYAIMRMLGVPGKVAGSSVVLPYLALSALAMPVGGIAGIFVAQDTAIKAFAQMAGAPEGFVPDASLPVCVVAACMVFEIGFTSFAAWLFLRKMKKTPPLELLHEGTARTGASRKADEPAPEHGAAVEFEIAKLLTDEMPVDKSYGALRHVSSYILRHMRRGIGKTAISLAMAVTLSAGMGMFVLLLVTYQDAYHQVDVKGRATEFSSDTITELAKSDLVKDLYCYENFEVHVDGLEAAVPLTVTNDVNRYLTDSCRVSYAEGYDRSIFDGTGQVCLVGQDLAKVLGIQAGDEIGMLSNDLFAFLGELYEEEEIAAAAQRAGKMYKVVGIVETVDAGLAGGIFTGIRSSAESVYGQPFPVGYCEFTLADNDRLDELDSLLDELKGRGLKYSKMASFHVDAGALKNIARVCGLLESLFPLAMAAAALIGVFGPLLVIHQSAQEAAFLRVLGVTKQRARCMLAFEQIILCIVGTALVSVSIALLEPGLFARSVQLLAACFGLYLLGGVCGAAMAAMQVTRHKILELLQVKE